MNAELISRLESKPREDRVLENDACNLGYRGYVGVPGGEHAKRENGCLHKQP